MDELKDLDLEGLCAVLWNIYSNYPLKYYDFINTELIPAAFASMSKKDIIILLGRVNISFGSSDGRFSEQLSLAL